MSPLGGNGGSPGKDGFRARTLQPQQDQHVPPHPAVEEPVDHRRAALQEGISVKLVLEASKL